MSSPLSTEAPAQRRKAMVHWTEHDVRAARVRIKLNRKATVGWWLVTAGVQFVPHVTLCAFSEDGARCVHALEEAEGMELDCQSVVDRLHLVKINSARSQIMWSKEFLL